MEWLILGIPAIIFTIISIFLSCNNDEYREDQQLYYYRKDSGFSPDVDDGGDSSVGD